MAHTDPLFDAVADELARRPNLTPETALRVVLDRDPGLYNHRGAELDGSRGTVGPEVPVQGSVPPGAPLAAGARHYRELAPWERVEQLRKLGFSERQVAGRTYVQKFGGDAAGLYEVVS